MSRDYPCVRVVNPSANYRDYNTSEEMTDIQKWQYLTGRYDGTNITFYVDGLKTDTVTWTGPVAHSGSKLLIGKDAMEDTFLKGIIDELRIYNYALTDSEVKALYDDSKKGTTLVGFQKKLVAEYQFEGNFNDSSGYGNNGMNINGVTFVPSVQGKGAKFNGNNFITINDSDSLDIDSAFTFSAWVYCENASSSGTKPIFSKSDTSVGDRNSPYAFVLDSQSLSARLTDLNYNYREYNNSTITMKNKSMHLLCATWDRSGAKNITFYLDGNRRDSVTWDKVISHSASRLVIGRDLVDTTHYFKGVLDDIRIYNYRLNDAQVKALYKKDTFTLNKPSTLKIKKTFLLKAVSKSIAGKSTTVTTKGVTYKSSNTKVATVSSTGKITAKAKGSATITATYGINTATASVKVIK